MGKLVEKLSSRALNALPLDDTDLDDAVLAKAGAVVGGLTATRPVAPGMLVPRGQLYAPSAVAPGSSEFASEAAKWAAAAKAQATTEMRRQPANTLTAAAAASEKMAPRAFADSLAGRREMTAAAIAALTG